MSTRGAVAFGNVRNWRGVYNHFDSYISFASEKEMRVILTGKSGLANRRAIQRCLPQMARRH